MLVQDAYAQFVQVRNSTGALIFETDANKNALDRFAFAPSVHPSYGVWTYPIIAIDSALLAVGIMYHFKKMLLPSAVVNFIRRVFSFDFSRRSALVITAALLGTYSVFGAFEAQQKEAGIDDPNSDYYQVKRNAELFSIDTTRFDPGRFTPAVGLFLLAISMDIFGNSRMVPFIASIAMLALTYLTAAAIAKKRLAGIVAMATLMQSPIFLKYDSSTPYSYIWAMFYLLSIYLVWRQWQLSAPAFVLSFLSKSLAGAFLPLSLVSVYDSPLPVRNKIVLAAGYFLLIAMFLLTVALSITLVGVGFSWQQFWMGINSVPILLQSEGLLLVLFLPVTVGLYVLARRGARGPVTMMVMIGGMIWVSGFLTGVTGTPNLDYRIIPLIVFFAVGTGLMFSRAEENKAGGQSLHRKLACNAAFFAVLLPVAFLVVSTFLFPALYSDQNFR